MRKSMITRRSRFEVRGLTRKGFPIGFAMGYPLLRAWIGTFQVGENGCSVFEEGMRGSPTE